MESSEKTVDLQIQDDIALLWLDRPHRLNAVSAQLVADLVDALDTSARHDLRALIITGRGRSFCAGQDLKEIEPPSTDPDARLALLRQAEQITRLVRAAPFPVIAAVHGYAMGAGCEIALMCDLIVADETSQFAFPEVSVAQAVGQGISHRLAVTVGPARAKQLLLFGERFSADVALGLGLINEVTPPGEHLLKAREWAMALSALSPLSVRLAKSVIDAGADGGLEDALALETEHLMAVHDDPAMQQAAQQFLTRN